MDWVLILNVKHNQIQQKMLKTFRRTKRDGKMDDNRIMLNVFVLLKKVQLLDMCWVCYPNLTFSIVHVKHCYNRDKNSDRPNWLCKIAEHSRRGVWTVLSHRFDAVKQTVFPYSNLKFDNNLSIETKNLCQNRIPNPDNRTLPRHCYFDST